MILSSAIHSIEVIAKKQFVALAVPRVAIPRHHTRIIFLASLLILPCNLPMANAQSTHEVEMGNRFGLGLENNGPAGDPGSGTTSQPPPPKTFEAAFDIQSNGKQIKHSCSVCHSLEVQIDGKRYQAGEVATLRGNQTYDITVVDTPRPLPPNAVTPPHPPEAYTARFTVYPMAVGNQTISEVSRATGSSPTPNDSPQAFIASKDEVLQYLIENTEGLFVRDKNWPENPADEPTRKKATIQHFPVDIAVDGNRDGAIQFASTQGALVDKTTANKPFRFWCNDDDDHYYGSDSKDVVPVAQPDHANNYLDNPRDLEDCARLWIDLEGLKNMISNGGNLKLGLKWKNTDGTSPKINIFRAEDETAGGDGYLKDTAAAERQAGQTSQLRYNFISGTVTTDTPMIFPESFWDAMNASNTTQHLLFEGAAEGKGQLCISIHDANGREIGEGPGVWLELKDVRTMYERRYGKPRSGSAAWKKPNEYNPYQEPVVTNAVLDSVPFDKPPDETSDTIVLVHGINGATIFTEAQSIAANTQMASTTFKRLWWQGFKGRFGLYKWEAHNLALFNESEYRAWKSGRGLAAFLAELPGDNKNIICFSQGGVVGSSAIRDYGATPDAMIVMQAAIPAVCYDDDPVLNIHANNLPDTIVELGYRGYHGATASRLINFADPTDLATGVGWRTAQNIKPEPSYSYNATAPVGQRHSVSYLFEVGRFATDLHESLSMIAEAKSNTIAHEPGAQGRITSSVDLKNTFDFDNEHGAAFDRPIQKNLNGFYDEVLTQFGIPFNP